MEVGLHQGPALSSLLFVMVMERLTDNVGQESPLMMRFADDIVIYIVTARRGGKKPGEVEEEQ